jgi:precorrin-4 C11-methyltransferase
MTGRVSFIGAGPGAADLITVRGAKRIAEADIVVWAASLVDPECVREHARPDAELVDSSLITHEDVLAVYRRAAGERLRVARVHSGDPSLWGAVQEQYDSAKKLGLDVEIVPGVSAFSAAAAIAGRELTVPEVAQSVILTRLEGGKTPMPEGEHIREFARHGTTMAIFLSAARSGQLVDELRAGGYADDTPVVVAYKVTWPDELVLHTTIGELTETVKQHKLWRHTLFLVGKALNSGGTRSHLYNAGHFHTYRKADPAARRALRSANGGTAAPADATEATEGTAETDQQSRPKAGWPLHTSRSGWVAARVGNWSGNASRSSATDTADSAGTAGTAETAGSAETVEPNPAGSPSVAAWSAVRGWQETAWAGRTAARSRSTGESAKVVRAVPDDQTTLSYEAVAEAPKVSEVDVPRIPAARDDDTAPAEPTPPVQPAPPAQQAQPAAPQVQSGPVAKPAAPKKTTARKSAARKDRKSAGGKPGSPGRTGQQRRDAAGGHSES